MIAVLLVLAVIPAAFGEPLDLCEIASSISAKSSENSGVISLLQREHGQIRLGKRGTQLTPPQVVAARVSAESENATEVQLTLPQAAATSVSGESQNTTEVQLTPPQIEALAGVSDTSANVTDVHLPSRKGQALSQNSSAATQAFAQVSIGRSPHRNDLAESVGQDESEDPPEKSKIVLMVIEMCPLCWLFAIDRFYLGNTGLAIAKLAVSLGSCFIGGLIWGLVDFIIIISNALRQEETLHAAGMTAKFPKDQLQAGFKLAFVDIVMVPAFVGLVRLVWWRRKQQRMEQLKQAAMRSPHYGMDSRQSKDG